MLRKVKRKQVQSRHGWQGPKGLGLAWILQNRKRWRLMLPPLWQPCLPKIGGPEVHSITNAAMMPIRTGRVMPLMKLICPSTLKHGIYIRIVSSKNLLSTLLNTLKLVYGTFWSVHLISASQEGSECTTKVYHSFLVDYLAQVIYAKNCPTNFYCIF
jgi:hypothetical protein